jgi:cyclic pyranopterin phosphate synthase
MSDAPSLYGFEANDERLPGLPTAARRALDLAGERLSADAWTALPLADRMALIALGTLPVVDPEHVRAIVLRADPTATTVEPKADPDPREPPAELAASVAKDRWASLSALDRYALSDAAAESPSRLREALHEIVPERFTHVNAAGEVHMVDVGAKVASARAAVASAQVVMLPATLSRLLDGDLAKGDVLATARVAGIQAAKRTSELIPLCHQVALTRVTIDIQPLLSSAHASSERAVLEVRATAEARDRTGVEMEALVAVTTAALTVYDMAKAVDRWITIQEVGLVEKRGGKSGVVRRSSP